MPFDVHLASRLDKDFRNAPEHVLDRLRALTEELAADPLRPRPGLDTIPVAGHPGIRRVRIGAWRVFYTVDLEAGRVLVTRASKRDVAYR